MLTIQRSFITKAQSSEEEEQLYQIVEQYMPYLAGLLYQLWQNQSKAITYRELKDMLSSGFVPPTLYTDWRQDYQNFVNNNLQSVWDDAIHAAADTYKNKYPDFQFVSSDESIRRWNMEHAAQLITRCTDEQYNALKALVRTATETDGATPDKLARSIRPLIGLNEPQARANQRYYNTLIANDVPREIAEQRRKLYTEQQLQYRAQMIARTELAASYNGGHYLSVLQAQQQGFMGECKRIWRTADTERTCPYCAALDGTEVGMEEDFIFTHGRQTTSVTTPPAHPHCMCTVTYEEIAQPEANEVESTTEDTQGFSEDAADNVFDFDDDIDYMSNSFRPEYEEHTMDVSIGQQEIILKKVRNSQFDLYADVDFTRRNKAVRFAERNLRGIHDFVPEDFQIPPIAVVDFDKYGFEHNAIAGYEKISGIVFLNSRYDTTTKTLEFLNKNKGEFANTTIYAPLLHEFGHCYYENCVKQLEKSRRIAYNKAEDVLNDHIQDLIHSQVGELGLGKVLSRYAQSGYSEHKYTEIVAEAFSATGNNDFAKLLNILIRRLL